MKQEGNRIIAEQGKVFKRKNHNDIFGNEIYLGLSYYIDGILLNEPHQDTPDDFEEIPDPDPTIKEEFIEFEEI